MTVKELHSILTQFILDGHEEKEVFISDDGEWYEASETKMTSVYLGYGISEEGVVLI